MIKTYPEMNEAIMKILKDSEEFKDQYIYQMLIEQQEKIKRYEDALQNQENI